MKKMFFLITVLVSFNVLANCPNLTGTYVCDSYSGRYTNTFSQYEENGHTVYTDSELGIDLHTNNQWQTVYYEGIEGKVRAYCQSNKLKSEIEANWGGMMINVHTETYLNGSRLIVKNKIYYDGDLGDQLTDTCYRK